MSNLRVRPLCRRGALLSAALLTSVAIGGATAAVASADTTTTDTTTTPTPPPPAPPGFADSLNSLYSTMYQTASTLDAKTGQTSTQQLATPGDFASSVAGLSSEQLAEAFAATQADSQWSQVSSEAQQALSDAQSAPPITGLTGGAVSAAVRPSSQSTTFKSMRVAAAKALASAAAAGSDTFPPDEPIGAFPAPPAAFVAGPLPVAMFSARTCVAGDPFAWAVASATALFVANEVKNVADDVGKAAPSLLDVGYLPSFPDPVKYVLQAIVFGATLVVDSFKYAQAIVDDCKADNVGGLTANEDNTTVNAYHLEQQNEQTMTNIQSSINTIHAQVHVVQQTVDEQLTLDIRRALSQPTASPPNVDYELPVSAGGNLDSTPIGVQAVVDDAFSAAKQAGLPVNAVASSDLNAATQALAANQYKTAWKDFQLAFQALGA